MCGICGTVGFGHPDVVPHMLEILAHRGPDDVGTHVSDGVALGARRLAIIDIANGVQPARSEDRRVVVILNGEIYNYRELRSILERRGHEFGSEADTEVLPHLYEEYGVEFTALLRGMFAIALWDDREQRLLLVRDRAGEKPLLYARVKSGLVFASELKALLAHPEVSRSLDAVSLRLFLALQYVPAPRTILEGVSKLPAGHRLVMEGGSMRVERYWDVVAGTRAHLRSRAGAARELREVLRDAVAAQVHADVPVGALLSGGIDSSTIVAFMRGVGSEPTRTFTVGFAGERFDERPQAREVATALGTEHIELVVEAPSFADLERIIWYLDEPVADEAAVPTFLIAQVASEHVKVVLTGEGSDELFGGYPRYRWFARAERLAQLPLPLRTLAARLTQQVRGRHQHNLDLMLTPRSTLERHLAWIGVFADEELDGLLEREVAVAAHDAAVEHLERLTEDWAERPPAERAMYADFKTWLVDDILTKADRMTMAASIEARAPFLDHRVIEFAFSLPSAARLAGAETKQLLRDAMTGSLPASVLARPKHAFLVPVERWLETRFATAIRELLLSNDAATRTLIRRRTVERLLSAHGRGVSHRLWTLAVLELWLRGMSAAPRGAPE